MCGGSQRAPGSPLVHASTPAHRGRPTGGSSAPLHLGLSITSEAESKARNANQAAARADSAQMKWRAGQQPIQMHQAVVVRRVQSRRVWSGSFWELWLWLTAVMTKAVHYIRTSCPIAHGAKCQCMKQRCQVVCNAQGHTASQRGRQHGMNLT